MIPKLKKYHADGYKIVIFSNQVRFNTRHERNQTFYKRPCANIFFKSYGLHLISSLYLFLLRHQAAIKSALGGVMSTKVRKRMNHVRTLNNHLVFMYI